MTTRRIAAIAHKEMRHILRDPFTLALAIMLPMTFVTVFGLAIELNVKNIRTAVSDADKTPASRQLADVMGSSRFFTLSEVPSPRAALDAVNANAAKAALIIDAPFEQTLSRAGGAHAQIVIDGADSSTVASVLGYIESIRLRAQKRLTAQTPASDVTVKTRFLYNPELNSRWFTIPGLTVVVIAVLSVLLTALTVAREWENGSMELLLSTPATPADIVIGKLIPYVGLGLCAVGAIYAISRLGLAVPFRGSHTVFLLGCLLFLAACLAQGLLISVVTREQRVAMQLAMFSSLIPSMLLSGFVFPIESMPAFFQWFTAILPARWFMVICRGLALKGTNVASLALPFAMLTVFAAVLLTAATKRFKKDVEP